MLWKIAWKNIVFNPLNSILSLSLILFGVSIISLLIIIQTQFENKFEKDVKGIDIVVGAKGSPLQLVLSAVYHIDTPTGNIKLKDAEKIMNDPMVDEAIPLAYGDNYKDYRILGTTIDYIEHYQGEISEGRLFNSSMETVIGATVAKKSNLNIGDSFLGTHGEAKEGHVHHNQNYTVVGILNESHTVLDQLILTPIESVWEVHSHHHHEDVHNENNEEHKNDLHHEIELDENTEITAVILSCQSKLAVLKLPQEINQKTNMQAVLPGLEINRLFYLLGIGISTIQLIAGGIIFMAGISIFFALFSRLRERRFELALLRTVGYTPWHVFGLLLLEGFLFSLIGYTSGLLLSRIGLFYINQQAESEFNFHFTMAYTKGEWGLFMTIILTGVIAALIPAIRAMKMNVSQTLSEK